MNSQNEIVDDFAAQEILRLAGEASQRMDTFSHENLVRAAAEMDIDEQWIIDAIGIVKDRQSEADDREEFKRAHIKETWKHVAIGVPLIAFFVAAHFLNMLAQAVSVLKGFIKSLTAVVFAKSTGGELQFQTWRNQRFYKVEYGTVEPRSMLAFYMRNRDSVTVDEMLDWLVETNAIEFDLASFAVGKFAEDNPQKVANPRESIKYPQFRQATIWTRDIRSFFKRTRKASEEP